MSEEDRAYVAQRKDEVEELRARCRGLEQLLTAYEQSRGKELERIKQLENDKLMLQGQLDMSRALVAGAKAEIAQLEEALRFYADKKRYGNTGAFSTSYQFGDYIEDDSGRRARAALSSEATWMAAELEKEGEDG